jgi:hypothetical protein
MNRKQKTELRERVLNNYKAMMPGLYKDFGKAGVSSDSVRLEVLRVITAHVLNQTNERLNRKTRKARVVKAETLKAFVVEIAPAATPAVEAVSV